MIDLHDFAISRAQRTRGNAIKPVVRSFVR